METHNNYIYKPFISCLIVLLRPAIKTQNKIHDKRSYKVDFTLFENLFPNFVLDYDLEKGIKDLVENYSNFSPGIEARRLNKINSLLKEKQIDNNFRFVKN